MNLTVNLKLLAENNLRYISRIKYLVLFYAIFCVIKTKHFLCFTTNPNAVSRIRVIDLQILRRYIPAGQFSELRMMT